GHRLRAGALRRAPHPLVRARVGDGVRPMREALRPRHGPAMIAILQNTALVALLLVGSLAVSLGLHLWARRAIGVDDRSALQLMWLLPLLALAAKLAVLIFVGLEIAPALGAGDAAERAWIFTSGLSKLL